MSTSRLPHSLDEFSEHFLLILALIGLLFAVLPAIFLTIERSFLISLTIEIMILAIFAMGYNILFGHTGLLSFGHAAFFGMGAYGVALSITGSFWLIPTTSSAIPALLIGLGLAALFGIVIGYLCVKRGDLYFAMLTIAFNMMLYYLVLNWESVTSGDDGIIVGSVPFDLVVFSFSSQNNVAFYYMMLVLVLVTLFVLRRIQNSSYGEILALVRENPERATAIGINVSRYQWSSFVISGVFAGLAGGLTATRNFVVSPGTTHWLTSSEPLVVALLGGFSTFFGPFVGAAAYTILEHVATLYTLHWQLVLGILLVLIVLFVPGGILGTLQEEDQKMPAALRRVGNRLNGQKDTDDTEEHE
jgi:branched-chain amino acid transport system permease protein